jgi:protein-tyrosine kinase
MPEKEPWEVDQLMKDLNREAPDSQPAGAEKGRLVHLRRESGDEQVGRSLARRREHQLRVGEAAMELRSQQFHYPLGMNGAAVKNLDSQLVAAHEPFSDRAEELRSLRRELLASVFPEPGKRALAVLSAEQGDGKTYLAANLAISFSQFAGRTLLIDANLRRPELHRLFKTSNEVGLGNLLAGDAPHEPVLEVKGLEGLHLLGAGSVQADPVQLLQGPRFSVLIEQMVDSFDFVFIDTPSNDAGPDARLIAARAGAAMLVGRKGHSRIELVKRLLTQLNLGPALVAGVVLNQH